MAAVLSTNLPETVYTAGYGGRSLEELLSMLRTAGVERLVDVRSFPVSRREDFSGENLDKALPGRGIGYVHMPELGGHREESYEAYVERREFRDALGKLEAYASEKPSAMMCLERHSSECHRRFVARELRERGWRVIHLSDREGGQTTL